MKLKVWVLIVCSMMLLAGCETMKGLGKDIQKAGKALEKQADD